MEQRLFLLLSLLGLLWTAHSEALVHELIQQNFTSSIGALNGEQVCLVEFYASWCPHCKHFAPIYEKAATFLAKKRLGLYVARVDCATETALCGSFNLSGYPSVFLGRAADYAAQRPQQLVVFERRHELPELLEWVGRFLNTTLKYEEADDAAAAGAGAALFAGPAPRRPLAAGPEWAVADVEGATLQLWSIMAATPALHAGPAKRAALREVLGGWAEAHPSASCRAASGRLLGSFDSLWPVAAHSAPEALLRASPCGPPSRLAWRGSWVTCAGSKPDSRGYSCGLWEMIHTMALRLPDHTAAASMLTFLTSFNAHFFGCEPCVRHFAKMLSAPDAAGLTDRRSVALWLWRVHNEVNERLRGIESRYGHSTSGDPGFPKELWPAPERCPDCRRGAGAGGAEGPGGSDAWDEEAVWAYLQRTYGRGSAPGADGEAASRRGVLLPALALLAVAGLLYAVVRMRSGGGGMGLGGRGRRSHSHGQAYAYGAGGLGGYGQPGGGASPGLGPGAK